jgi:hypothetical protein
MKGRGRKEMYKTKTTYIRKKKERNKEAAAEGKQEEDRELR